MKVIEDLIVNNSKVPVIVEGKKDVKALKTLGLSGDILTLNHGIPIFNFCEEIARTHREVIILTDWDSRGGRLAKALREGLSANGVKHEKDPRAKLVILCKKEIKDIEALPKFIRSLERKVGHVLR